MTLASLPDDLDGPGGTARASSQGGPARSSSPAREGSHARTGGPVRTDGPVRTGGAGGPGHTGGSGGGSGSGRPRDRIRVLPAPRREPPFDDELPARHLSVVGPLDQQLPFADVVPREILNYRLARPPRGAAPEPEPVTDDLPALEPFARRLVIAIIETATGRRSAFQLRHNMSPAVLNGLTRDAGHTTRLGSATRPATLHSVHTSRPADGVAEVAAVVRDQDRFRAVALRLEASNGRWRCVRLQIG